MRFWETPDFKSLEAEWYARLEAAGFTDIERRRSDDRLRHDLPRKVQIEIGRERRFYHDTLSAAIPAATFAHPADRIIMKMRAAGARVIEICDFLDALGAPRHRETVRFRIRRYEQQWGLRTYTPKQLDRKTG